MDKPILQSEAYTNWLTEIRQEYQFGQSEAAARANTEMLHFFWKLGKGMCWLSRHVSRADVVQKVSNDLNRTIPTGELFTPLNLYRICKFQELFPSEADATSEGVFTIPWSYLAYIADECSERDDAHFFVKKICENSWSLQTFLSYGRACGWKAEAQYHEGPASIPIAPQDDLARGVTIDPYLPQFLSGFECREDEIQERRRFLRQKLRDVLLSMRTGFAFVGEECLLRFFENAPRIELLFYNYRIHCFVAVETRIDNFDPDSLGKIGSYVSEVDSNLRGDCDNPTVGLIVWQVKDRFIARYAVSMDTLKPEISADPERHFRSPDYRDFLPRVKELEGCLNK